MSSVADKPGILVVEDENIVARDLQQQLLEQGYRRLSHATTGEQAIALAEQLRPDLVLMDIQLAGKLDGIAAAQIIRTHFHIPVVFLTAYAAEEVLARAKLSEPYGYILKPFSERELYTVIEMALYKHKTEMELREAAIHSQTILDNMADGVVTIDPRGIIEGFNKAACRIFGYDVAEVMGQNVTMLMPENRRDVHINYLDKHNRTGHSRIIDKPQEMEGQRKDGSRVPISLLVSKIERKGRVTFIGLIRDITQRRRDEEEINRLAFYDPLTGLPNRRLLVDRLWQAIITADRNGQHGALMFLDLDHFKQLNDTQGHDLGDILLQQVAKRLQDCLREGDSVARLGGDEFVILLEALSVYGLEAASQAEVIALKILEQLRQPYNLKGMVYNVTPSMGIVIFAKDDPTVDELLKKADVAMYQAKAAGRNTARFFDPAMQAAAETRAELEKNLRHGLTNNEFLLNYQVQVDRVGKIMAVEALVRWNHSKLGLITPASFIPMAEETGIIQPLGQWVLETACEQLVAWSSHPERRHWTMSVNVSAAQFALPDFSAKVAAALAKTGANPERLKLEITESMLLHNLDDVIGKMNCIRTLGVTFALDDFGTGYSSLSYLKRLPLNQLKIDRSFVNDLLTDPHDAAIAKTVLALGHSLNLMVIAEGVETAEQFAFLTEIGCDGYQGYHFGRPVAADDLP
jgi:diguanylate cyclase (GGDEF)-like protein/PAS domain S-box-containing protein